MRYTVLISELSRCLYVANSCYLFPVFMLSYQLLAVASHVAHQHGGGIHFLIQLLARKWTGTLFKMSNSSQFQQTSNAVIFFKWDSDLIKLSICINLWTENNKSVGCVWFCMDRSNVYTHIYIPHVFTCMSFSFSDSRVYKVWEETHANNANLTHSPPILIYIYIYLLYKTRPHIYMDTVSSLSLSVSLSLSLLLLGYIS